MLEIFLFFAFSLYLYALRLDQLHACYVMTMGPLNVWDQHTCLDFTETDTDFDHEHCTIDASRMGYYECTGALSSSPSWDWYSGFLQVDDVDVSWPTRWPWRPFPNGTMCFTKLYQTW